MRKYKYLSFLILALISIVILSACGQNIGKNQNKVQSTGYDEEIKQEKPLVYTTIFPLYDFARQIGGEYVEVKNIIPPGAEAHDFEPTPKEMVELNKAQIFIYNGVGFEGWIEKAIDNLDQNKTIVVHASEGIELVAGDGHDHDAEDHGAEDHADDGYDHDASEEAHDLHDHGSYDPHVWLNPMNAKEQAARILDAFVKSSPEHKTEFEKNFQKLVAELEELDTLYQETLKRASKKEVVVSHQAFGYLANRYGFEQIPVAGLSPEAEPSQKAIIELITTLKEHDLKYIAYDSFVINKVAQTIQREVGAEAVTLYTIENITKEELDAGKTYIDLMKENLETLKKVLEVQ